MGLLCQLNRVTACEALDSLGQPIGLEFWNVEGGISQMLLDKKIIEMVVVTM